MHLSLAICLLPFLGATIYGATITITQDQFNRACQTKGGRGNALDYQLFMNSFSRARISDKMEAAKYLAHTVWESAGMTQWREIKCQIDSQQQSCEKSYGVGPTGEIFYGRGPIQLTHRYNYRDASKALFGDENVLLRNPDMVASNREVGWNTAAWFWGRYVHAKSTRFGPSLRAINGSKECRGLPKHWRRCDHYRRILGILGLPLPDRNKDCRC